MRDLKKSEILLVTFLCIGFIIAKLAFANYITFFWDAIANLSKPAYFYYETNFHTIFLPDNYVSDPPLLQLYIALMWKIFGKSLFTTHMVMSIFPLVTIFQLYILCKKFISEKNLWLIFFLVLVDTTFLTQELLIDNDEVVICFALLSINAILSNKRYLLALYLLGMGLVSIRGMDIVIGLGIAYLLIYYNRKMIIIANLFYALIPFLPILLLFTVYIISKKVLMGYFFISPTNPWKEYSNVVSPEGLIHNVLALGFVFLDYGRVFIWIIALFLLWKFGYKKIFTPNNYPLWIILFSIFFSMMLVTIPIQNPIGERYFTLHFLLFTLLIGGILFENLNFNKARLIVFLLIIGLLSGTFWIYPAKKAQAWDASLVHLPYYSLKKDVMSYFEERHIDFSTVGFGFPNTAEIKYIEVNNDNRHFTDLNFQKNKYIVYSHFPNWKSQLDSINHTTLIKTFRQGGIVMSIYKNTYLTNRK